MKWYVALVVSALQAYVCVSKRIVSLSPQYGTLPYSKQKEIADDLERTPGEIIKKLEDTRNALL